jgi:hypothetical protein
MQPLSGLLSSRSEYTYQQFVRSLTVLLAATNQNVIRACVRRWSPQQLQEVTRETAWFPLSPFELATIDIQTIGRQMRLEPITQLAGKPRSWK